MHLDRSLYKIVTQLPSLFVVLEIYLPANSDFKMRYQKDWDAYKNGIDDIGNS